MNDFTEYDDDFEAAPEPTRGAAVPDGDYVGELVALDIKTFDDGGKRLEYTFRITEGPHANLRIWKNENIPAKGDNNPKAVNKRGYLMMDAKAVSGNKDIKFSEYLTSLETYVGRVFKIYRKQNGKYVNVTINERVDTAVAPAPAPAPAQPALPGVPVANDIPF